MENLAADSLMLLLYLAADIPTRQLTFQHTQKIKVILEIYYWTYVPYHWPRLSLCFATFKIEIINWW